MQPPIFSTTIPHLVFSIFTFLPCLKNLRSWRLAIAFYQGSKIRRMVPGLFVVCFLLSFVSSVFCLYTTCCCTHFDSSLEVESYGIFGFLNLMTKYIRLYALTLLNISITLVWWLQIALNVHLVYVTSGPNVNTGILLRMILFSFFVSQKKVLMFASFVNEMDAILYIFYYSLLSFALSCSALLALTNILQDTWHKGCLQNLAFCAAFHIILFMFL